MSKKMDLISKDNGGIDLLIERDAGNEVRILTGKYAISLEFWYDLQSLVEKAITILEDEENERRKKSENY
jgi:hypothetical protein